MARKLVMHHEQRIPRILWQTVVSAFKTLHGAAEGKRIRALQPVHGCTQNWSQLHNSTLNFSLCLLSTRRAGVRTEEKCWDQPRQMVWHRGKGKLFTMTEFNIKKLLKSKTGAKMFAINPLPSQISDGTMELPRSVWNSQSSAGDQRLCVGRREKVGLTHNQ